MSEVAETPVVTVFLRNRGDILLLHRSEDVGSYPHRWGTVAGHLEENGSYESALAEIQEETGLSEDEVSLVREGPSFPVVDSDRATRWIVHPFLFDAHSRSVILNWETDEAEWAPPTVLLRRDTVPDLWTSYRRVAPSTVSLTDDTTHGSNYLALRALEVLRDRAGVLATSDIPDLDDTDARLKDTARQLLGARPSMTALENRIHRVMHASQPNLAPSTVEGNAHEAIDHALTATDETAETAGDLVDGSRVLTLSRSGTVLRALRTSDPAAVVVATSHPGGEGIQAAEILANDGLDVTLCPDAACATILSQEMVDLVLVGADSVHPSGAVVNKVGTRAVGLAARHENIPFYAACTVDKISVEAHAPREDADWRDVYNGPANVGVRAPRFDVTPPSLVTGGLVTDRGVLPPEDVASLRDELEALRAWM